MMFDVPAFVWIEAAFVKLRCPGNPLRERETQHPTHGESALIFEPGPLLFCLNKRQQIADVPVRFDGMTQWLLDQHGVLISPPHAFAFDKTSGFKILNDPLNGPFGNPHFQCDFPQHYFGVVVQHDKHM